MEHITAEDIFFAVVFPCFGYWYVVQEMGGGLPQVPVYSRTVGGVALASWKCRAKLSDGCRLPAQM